MDSLSNTQPDTQRRRYCMQTVRGVARDDVSEAWGEEVTSSDDYATILELEDKMGGLVEITERVWISVESAMCVAVCGNSCDTGASV
jgi:hypothetical protein